MFMSSPSRLVEHVAYYIFYVRWNGNPGRYHTVKLEIRLVFNVLQVEISCVTLENASRRVSKRRGQSTNLDNFDPSFDSWVGLPF
jgi:hypothetical protein